MGKRHHVHSKLMSWIALDRGAASAAAFGEPALHDAWRQGAATIHADICDHGLSAQGTYLGGAYGNSYPDAALLLMAVHGFMRDDDALMVRTVDWVRSEVRDGCYLSGATKATTA